MKKRWYTAAVCVAMSMALCACSNTNQTVNDTTPTPVVGPETPESTPAATATPTVIQQMEENLPLTNYEEYVESTVLPEGYRAIEVEKVTEAEVDAYVQEVLENNKERQLKDGAIELGDIAIIDYTGYMDGVTFEGGSDVGFEMEVGNANFIEGFETGLVGAKKGETVTLNLKFPENYHSTDLAGKDVMFEVKINSVAAQVLPEFTDEFVTEITSGEYTTTKDFRDYSRGFLSEERRYNTVMDYLVDNATFGKLNEEYITAAFELEKEYYALMYGCESVAQFEEVYGAETSGMLWELVEYQIRRYEKDRVVLYCVAKAENMELSDETYNLKLAEYADSVGVTVEDVLAVQDEASLRQSMLMESALEFLLESAVEVEKGEE